jgi:hypothetical protein
MATIDACITALNTRNWKVHDNISTEVKKAFEGIISSTTITDGVLVCCKYTIQTTLLLRARTPHIFNTKKIPVQYLSVEEFKQQNLNDTFQRFVGLHFEFDARYLRNKNEHIAGDYNTLFVNIIREFEQVNITDEDSYNAFIKTQLGTMENGVKTITLTKNMYYIFLTTLHIYDALHDYKPPRSANMNTHILKSLLEIQKTKLNGEHRIRAQRYPNNITPERVTQFEYLFGSTNIESDIKTFSTALLKDNLLGITPDFYYNQAKVYFDSEAAKLQNSPGDKDIHHIVSNAPSRYKYDNELLDNQISPASTLNNNCFANIGTIMDGSTAGMCGTVIKMLEYNRVNLQIGESNIRMGCDDTNYIQYNSKIFRFGNKLYSSLIVKRVVGSTIYYAHYVYKVLDKHDHSSDKIHVGTQSTRSKYPGGDTAYLFKYCPPFMGEFVRANTTDIIDNRYNKDPKLSRLFDYSINKRDIIHYAWKSLCDFTQSWLTLLKNDTTYTKSYIQGNVHPLIVIHGDQPAHSLNEIILRFSKADSNTNINTNMHTVLALKNCLKISNVAGIVTYIDLRLLKKTNLRSFTKSKRKSYKSVRKYSAKIPKPLTRKIKPSTLIRSTSLPRENIVKPNLLSNSLPKPVKRERPTESASIGRQTTRNNALTPRRSLRISKRNRGGSPPSTPSRSPPKQSIGFETPAPSKKTPPIMTKIQNKSAEGIQDTTSNASTPVKNMEYQPHEEENPNLPLLDERCVIIVKLFLDPDIVNNILNFKYTSEEILYYNAFLFTMFTKNKEYEEDSDLPTEFSTTRGQFYYDPEVYNLLNNDVDGNYNELFTIYKAQIDKNRE